MKKSVLKLSALLLLVFSETVLFAQENNSTKNKSGTYYLLESERFGVNVEKTKTKLFQFGENKGTKLLAIAACEKCIPAVYTYQEADSNKLGVPVYFNSSGFYIIGYNENSFVNVLVTSKLGDKVWSSFSFSNFYSKNITTVNNMTKEKIETYAIELSEK